MTRGSDKDLLTSFTWLKPHWSTDGESIVKETVQSHNATTRLAVSSVDDIPCDDIAISKQPRCYWRGDAHEDGCQQGQEMSEDAHEGDELDAERDGDLCRYSSYTPPVVPVACR